MIGDSISFRLRFPDKFIRSRMECKEGIFGIGGSGAKTTRQQELSSWGSLQNIGGFATPFGENQIKQGGQNLSNASDFWNSLLSGDKTKIGQTLAPEIGTIEGQTQQQLDTLSQFGNRSGGTNATLNALQTNKQAQIQGLIDTLIPQAASQVAQIGQVQESAGSGVLSLGENAYATVGGQTTSLLPTQLQLQQEIQGAIMSSLINGAGIVTNAATSGSGVGGFGEG